MSWPMARSRDAGHEVLDDLEVDVRLEQRQADLAHRGVDVGLADAAAAGQVGERRPQAVTERIEHAEAVGSCVDRPGRRRSRPGVRGFWRHRGFAV